jgi:molybdate transport system substrate-binding protein
MNSTLRILLVLATLLAPAAAEAQNLNVFAAASLKTALDEVDGLWQSSSGNKAVAVYGASSALAKQIAEGAPADVFISADRDWMDDLETKGLIRDGTRGDLLGNTLVLIAPIGSGLKLELTSGVDLLTPLKDGRLATGETKSVPAGRYARAALESLGVWDKLSSRLAEQVNVRAALQLVARGEATLGIVYGSDAVAENKVEVAGVFPESSHPPIVYPVAILQASTAAAAKDYLAFLHSAAAAQLFQKNGFTLIK